MLAGHLATRTEGLHADIVKIGGAMHGCDGVGLRQNEKLAITRARAQFAAQQRAARLGAAQDPKPGVRFRDDAVRARSAHQSIVAITDKEEMPLLHPFEQAAGLGHFSRGQRRRAALQGVDNRLRALLHGHPVADGAAHVAQRCGEFSLELPQFGPDRSGDRSRRAARTRRANPARARRTRSSAGHDDRARRRAPDARSDGLPRRPD